VAYDPASRDRLREHFEVNANFIAAAALYALMRDGTLSPEDVKRGIDKLGINPDKVDPILA
jgi:pyruvate dehydrogenase E1 component